MSHVTLTWKQFEILHQRGLGDTALYMLQPEKLDALKLTSVIKVHWKGRIRGREGMSTRGKQEERGEALINVCLFR